MSFVVLTTPQGPVAVNPFEVFCIVPEAQTVDEDCEIQFDSPRQLLALHTADAAAARLAADLRRLTAASTDFDHVWINPARVTSVAPHPQVAGVCFVIGGVRSVPVKGDLEAILGALS
jgi:hypothetical protein